MRKILFASSLALVLTLSALSASAAQTRRGKAAPAKPQTPARAQAATHARQAVPLPASDAVMMVDLRRLLNEAVPRALEGDAGRLAQVNADIEQFKTRTGIEARAFDTLAVGARFTSAPSGAAKIDHVVAVARGSFNPESLVAAGRLAAKGGFREQQHDGRTVYLFNLGEQVRLFGLLKLRVNDLALAVLSADTLAVGEPAAVRATIDAQVGRGAERALLNSVWNSTDLIAFAGNVPPAAFAGIDVGLPDVNRSLASIRGFHGSLGMTAAGFQLTTALRAQSAADARQLGNTAEALKMVAPGLISMAGARAQFAKGAIESLRITTQGNEVRLRLELAQGDVAAIMRAL